MEDVEKKVKVGEEFQIKITDVSEALYELPEYEVKIEIEPDDVVVSRNVEAKDSGFIATLVPEEAGRARIKAVFEVGDYSEESNTICIRAVRRPKPPPAEIRIILPEMRQRAHLPVFFDVEAYGVSEFVCEVDDEKVCQHDIGDEPKEVEVGRLSPREHSVKVYDKKNPTTSDQKSITVYPTLYCRVSDDFYDVTGGKLPELIVTIDKFSELENFLDGNKNDDLYKQELNLLYLQRKGEIFELSRIESERISSAEPYKRYRITYEPSEKAKLESGVYQVQWKRMGILEWMVKESKNRFAIGLDTQVISEPRVFIRDFDIDVATRGGEESIREIQDYLGRTQNPLRLKLRRRNPDLDLCVSCDLSDRNAMVQDVKENHGPGSYEVLLVAGNREISRTETEVLDFFLFPTEIPAGGTSYIQFMGPPETEPPEIKCNGGEVGAKFTSPYLTTFSITPVEPDTHEIKVRWMGEKRSLSLRVTEGDLSDSCLNVINQTLHQMSFEGPGTSVLVVSPLKRLYFSPIRQWVNELLQEHDEITVGTLYWMIPEFRDWVESIEEAMRAIESRGLLPLFVEKSSGETIVQDPRVYDCPECGLPLRGVAEEKCVSFECENGHHLDRIQITLEHVLNHPPDLLFVSQDFFEKKMCAGQEYDAFLRERWGCPECNRVDLKYTRVVRLGGMKKIKSILRAVREELDEEIQLYKAVREYKRLWRRHRRISTEIEGLKKEEEELSETVRELHETFHRQREELALNAGILLDLSMEEHRMEKEQTRILERIEELKESDKQKFFLRRAVERFLALLFPFYKGLSQKGEVRELLNRLNHSKEITIFSGDLRRSLGTPTESLYRLAMDCWNEITDVHSTRETVRNKMAQLKNDLGEIREEIREKWMELENRGAGDPNKFLDGFWKKFSEKLEAEFNSDLTEERRKSEEDVDLGDYRQIYSDSVEEFINNVKKGSSKLIRKRNLKLDVHSECLSCGCEWEPVKKRPVLILNKPKSQTLPDYLRCKRLDRGFVEKQLGPHVRDVVFCEY